MFTSKSAQYTDVKNQNISPLVGLDSLYYEQATYNSTPGAQTNYVITREAVYKHMPIQLFNSSVVTPYEFDPSVNTAPESLQNTQKITAIPNQEKNILVLNQVSTFLVDQTNIPLHGVEANRCVNLSDILYNYNSKYNISEYYNMYNSSISSAYSFVNTSLNTCLTEFDASIKKMDSSTRFNNINSSIVSIQTDISTIQSTIDSQLDNSNMTVYQRRILSILSRSNKLNINETYVMEYDTYANKFLISLIAVNSSQFSPVASVQKIAGDAYFANSDVAKWEIKYDFDNNAITYMKDEFGNEAPYDFKNIISPRTSYLFNNYNNTDYSLTGECTNNTVNSTWHNISFVNTTSTQKNIQYNYIGYDSSNIVINDGHNNKVLNHTQNVTIYGNNNYIGNNNNDVIVKTDNNIIKNNNVSINIDISSINNIIGNYNNKVELKASSNTKIYNNCTSIYSNNSNNNTFFGYNSYIQIDNDSTQWPYSYTASGSTVKIANPLGENIFHCNVAGTATTPIELTNTNNIQIYSEIQAGKTYDYSDAYSFIFNGDVSSWLTVLAGYRITQHISNDILLAKDTDSTASYSAENNEWLVDRSTPTKFYITTLNSSNPITSNTGDVTIKPNTAGWDITNTYSNKHYIHINPKSITQTVNVDLLYDNSALLPNNLYKDTTPSNMYPLPGWGDDKSAFCYKFRSTQYPSDAYTLDTNDIWDGPYNMKQGINLPSLNIWGKSDKFPNVYISSNLFSRRLYKYTDPDFGITTVTSHGIVPFTDAVGNITLKLYGNAVKDITKIVYSKSDDTNITVNTVHEFTVGDSSLVKFKAESNPNVNSGLAYNTELTVSSSINNIDETLNITLSYNLIDRAGSHRYLGYSGKHNTLTTIGEPNKLDNYPKLTFKTKNGKTIDSSVLLDIGTCYGEISFEVRWAFLPPGFIPGDQHDTPIREYYMRPTYTFSHFEYDSVTGNVTNFVFAATSFNTNQNYIDDFSVIPTSVSAFYNMGYQSQLNNDPYMLLHQDLTDATKLAYLYIPISELTSVMCNEFNDQVYIHNYDTDNYEIENPDSSNGILRLQYYIDYDIWWNDEEDTGEGPNINDYLMKVYYRTDRGDDLPLDYVLNFNCKQLYRRQFAPEVLEPIQPV